MQRNEAGVIIRTSQRRYLNYCGRDLRQMAAKSGLSLGFTSGMVKESGGGGSSKKKTQNARKPKVDAKTVATKVVAAATKAVKDAITELGVSAAYDPKLLIYVGCTAHHQTQFNVKTNLTSDKFETREITDAVRSFVKTLEEVGPPLEGAGLASVKDGAVSPLCFWWPVTSFNQHPPGLPICLDERTSQAARAKLKAGFAMLSADRALE